MCRNSTESTILSICGTIRKESSHCTCKDEASCICLENKRKLKSLSEDCSDCCTNWKEIQKLTDTSETKLTDSFERLLNCVENGGDTSMYLDLFEPHPREEQRIKGKDSVPLGYNMTLILPQCVCLKSKLLILHRTLRILFYIELHHFEGIRFLFVSFYKYSCYIYIYI